MKLKNIILIGIAAIGFASCNDWLDIQPKTKCSKPNQASKMP